VEEGIELNLLGLVLGVDPLGLGVKLPGIGRLALREAWPRLGAEAPPIPTIDPGSAAASSR
jgi:hypothetical protein